MGKRHSFRAVRLHAAGTSNYSALTAAPIAGYSPEDASSQQTAPSRGYPPWLGAAPGPPS